MTRVPKSPTLCTFAVFLFIILFAPPSLSDIPKLINYQGKVTDTGGTPVADGTYSMQFSIYDSITAGNLEWSSASVSVNVSSGIFEVLLGDSPQPTLDIAFDEDCWLEVVVDSDVQSPRVKLGSVGYAYMASGLIPGTEVSGSVTSVPFAALKGRNTATLGTSFGIIGQSDSTAGRGVWGYTPATSGTTSGVSGQSASSAGQGVSGYVSATSGTTCGVWGRSVSTEGRGVYAEASATSGDTYGAFCWSKSTSGCGVYGLVSATSGSTRGVYGYVNSPSGAGVVGYSNASSGTSHGVYGQCASSAGHGVYGVVTASEGATFGVYGSSQSSEGTGVFGGASATSGTTCGVAGTTSSPSGKGIYGQSLSSTGYGVFGYNPGGWAAGFDGDVDLDGRLVLPDNDATPSMGSGVIEIGSASRALRLDGNEIITNTGELLHIQRDNGGDLQVDGGTLHVDSFNDRVGIGTTTPGYKLQVGNNGDGTEARANAWNILSSRKYKSDITPLDASEYSQILEQLVETDVVRYRFYQDEHETQHLGIIAEDAPRDIVTREGEALSLSDYCAFLLAATKAQQERIEALETEIQLLKIR